MKKWIALCLIISALLFSGCDNVLDKLSGSYDDMMNSHQTPSAGEDYPELEDMTALREFVLEMSEDNEWQYSFIYSGNDFPDPGILAQLSGACFIEVIQEGTVYHINLTEFPGSRIVSAYFSGQTENLSDDEQLALDAAVDVVKAAKEMASDDWELELAIHDLLAERITYSDADIFYDQPENQPRHLSVIGALLDGQANCQGYTDAFYTVASLAGFTVDRQSVVTSTDPHMINTICLDEEWYVVDLTYDDSNDDAVSYHLFNAGMDMVAQEYSWSRDVQRHPIIRESNDYNYYIRNDLRFGDALELAEYTALRWARYGQTVIQAMIMDEDEPEKLNKLLPSVLESYEKSYRYSVSYGTNGEDSFYTIVFKE